MEIWLEKVLDDGAKESGKRKKEIQKENKRVSEETTAMR